MKTSMPIAGFAWCLVACSSGRGDVKQEPAAAPPAIDFAAMDPSIRPGDDFFGYANGGWLKSHPIPEDRAAFGVETVLEELTVKRTADLIAEAAKGNAPPGSEARQIGDYYASYLDEAAIEARGLAPLEPELAQIAQISDAAGLARALGATLRADVDVLNATHLHTSNLFGLWVAQDLDQPGEYSPFLLQGGLGMPDRSYYLDGSERMAALRGKYEAHVARMLELAGIADAPAKAKRIVGLETRIAKTHATVAETEDVEKGNNHWTRKDLDARAPGLDWSAFLGAAQLERPQRFTVWQPGAVTGSSALVRSEPLQTWKDYLAFHAVERRANVLPKRFVDEAFAFYGTALAGTPKLRARWKRAMAATDEALGEAVGKLYVARYFPPSEKARAARMVQAELAAFRLRIDRLDWMAPRTKERAKAKLDTLKVGVGYPDSWRDYSGLEVKAGDAYGNAERASLFEYRRNLAKLGRPVDRGEWVMNPQLINAVNLPAMNALNFPAAILQPPYFDPNRPEVMDYAATGAVIGHEISHSFDDQGALFDAQGRLQNWWTPEDFAHFKASSQALVKQFDAYRPFPDLAVNGKQTVSENIADLAGLAVAYDAYHLAQGDRPAAVVDGFGPDKLFFLAFAQSWCTQIRPEALRQELLTDGHAPPQYRGQTVRNLDAWYAAYDVQPGQALYLNPPERVRVW